MDKMEVPSSQVRGDKIKTTGMKSVREPPSDYRKKNKNGTMRTNWNVLHREVIGSCLLEILETLFDRYLHNLI